MRSTYQHTFMVRVYVLAQAKKISQDASMQRFREKSAARFDKYYLKQIKLAKALL